MVVMNDINPWRDLAIALIATRQPEEFTFQGELDMRLGGINLNPRLIIPQLPHDLAIALVAKWQAYIDQCDAPCMAYRLMIEDVKALIAAGDIVPDKRHALTGALIRISA
jgi:hypothetical protein